MDEQEIEILIEVCDTYHTLCEALGAEDKLMYTMVGDTLLRLRSGEYEIRRNPNW